MSSVTEANTSTLGKQGETLFRLLDWLALQTRCSFLRKTGQVPGTRIPGVRFACHSVHITIGSYISLDTIYLLLIYRKWTYQCLLPIAFQMLCDTCSP